MILELSESYFGEFDQDTKDLKKRAVSAANKAVSQLIKKAFVDHNDKCNNSEMRKGDTARGGNVYALDDLSSLVGTLYKKRIDRMKEDLVKAVKNR